MTIPIIEDGVNLYPWLLEWCIRHPNEVLDYTGLNLTADQKAFFDQRNGNVQFALTNNQAVKDAYLDMVNRLEQIQSAANPTNAQVIQAIKDESLYIERLMKVIKALVT